MSQVPPEEAQERDVNRSFILSLAGFSFTAVAGFSVLQAADRIALQLPTWYVLLSFVAYISTLNVQSYKSTRLHNQFATALVELATFSLMISLVALLFAASFDPVFQWAALIVTLAAWALDHGFRLYLDYDYLKDV